MAIDDGTVFRLTDEPLPGHHDHRQRRQDPGLDGGVAADRVAVDAGVVRVGDRTVGDDGAGRAAVAGRCSRRWRRSWPPRNEDFPFMAWRDATVAGSVGPGGPDLVLR